MARTTPVPSLYLRTLGAPALLAGGSDATLRRKDLALLAYLRIEAANTHARSTLASLLWAENTEREARHSLSQALVRLRQLLGKDAFATTRELVGWAGRLPCDAVRLEEIADGEVVRDEMLRLYAGDFMAGFSPGTGGGDFERWLEQRRTGYRDVAVRLLERCGEEAEEKEEWEDALRFGGRLVEIDPFRESGHRRIMRALHRTGERARALLHYDAYEKRLADEIGLDPHRDTQRLAREIRESAAADEPIPEPPARNLPVPPPEPEPEPEPTQPAEPSAPDPPDSREEQSPAAVLVAVPPPPPPPTASPEPARPHPPRRHALPVLLGAAALAGLLWLGWWRTAGPPGDGPTLSGASPEPHNGESIRPRGEDRTFLVFGRTLYEYPDRPTREACTGSGPGVVREVGGIPGWPLVRLPSVGEYPWLRGRVPLISDNRADITAHVLVGCVLAAIPSPEVFTRIFGDAGWERMEMVSDSVLRSLPRMTVMAAYPHRPAGTLIRGSGGELKWVVFYEGALSVSDSRVLESHCRSAAEAIRVPDAEFRAYRVQAPLQQATSACPAH
jgi:DNA-binding SARP family transcriptional activator